MKPKHRGNLFVVMRHDFSGKDVVVASSLSLEKAEELVGEYTQQLLDIGISVEECYFYPTMTVFYNE